MGEQPASERLLTENEVADRLNVSRKTLQKWRWSGIGLPFIKIGAAVRYSPSDLAAFIAAGRSSTGAVGES